MKNCEECGWPTPCDCEPDRKSGSVQSALNTHTFFEVVWRRCGGDNSLYFVSDPFSDMDSAQHYADWRARNECQSEVWEVVKKKRKVSTGRELIDENGN